MVTLQCLTVTICKYLMLPWHSPYKTTVHLIMCSGNTNDLEDNSSRGSICQELKEDLEKIILHCELKNVVTIFTANVKLR